MKTQMMAAVLAATLAVPAMAQPEGENHTDRIFERIDSNGDGQIDRAEFQAGMNDFREWREDRRENRGKSWEDRRDDRSQDREDRKSRYMDEQSDASGSKGDKGEKPSWSKGEHTDREDGADKPYGHDRGMDENSDIGQRQHDENGWVKEDRSGDNQDQEIR